MLHTGIIMTLEYGHIFEIIKRMYPVVKCMLDDMRDAAKDKMMQIDCAGDFGGVEFPPVEVLRGCWWYLRRFVNKKAPAQPNKQLA